MARSFAYLFERFPSLTQTFCYREVQEMRRQGMDPAIFSIRVPEDAPADCPEDIKELVQYLPPDEEVVAGVKQRLERKQLSRAANITLTHWGKFSDKRRAYVAAHLGPILRKQGICHVHAHFAGIAARTAYWLKEFCGIHYSFTAHANDIFCETDFPVTLADLVREASFISTVTDYSRDWLRKRFPADAKRIHRVYNGIDVSVFCEAKPPAGKPRIISIGRCIEKKGYPDLINACALLRDRGMDFECLIVGSGPLEDALKAQIGALKLDGIVQMLGARPQEEVRALLATSSLFVLACATEPDGGMDNLPTVIVEAMACGLPVVSTRLAGVPEMVREGVTGFLTNEKDPLGLANAVSKALADPVRAKEMGFHGRALARALFTTEVTTGQLKRLLLENGAVGLPWAVFRQNPALGIARMRGMLRLS